MDDENKEKKSNKKLSIDEIEFIKKRSLDSEWTDEKMAAYLKRSVEVIRKYRVRFGLRKGHDNLSKIKTYSIHKENINKSNLSLEEKIQAWKEHFYKTPRYRKLSDQLMDRDLDNFVHEWAQFCTQFDDLKPSEELQLETLITFKLRIDDNRRAYKVVQEQEKVLQEKILGKDKELDLENEKDRFAWEMIEANNAKLMSLNKEYQELTKVYDQYFKALNSTREQREQFEKVGADTFLNMVRQFNDLDRRREVGKYNELMKEATKQKLKQLKEPYKFADNTIEPIIMDGADYKKKVKEKNVE